VHGRIKWCHLWLGGTICPWTTKEVLYAPGLTQKPVLDDCWKCADLVLTMNPQGEFVSVRQHSGKKLCDVSKTKSRFLLKAKALDGNTEKFYHAMLAREGTVIAASAMLTSSEHTDICELWHRCMGHPSPNH
jgi:hypothetical protein